MLWKASTDDINAVELGFGSNLLVADFEPQNVVSDIEFEVLAHLVLVNDLTYSHPNIVFAMKLTFADPVANTFQPLVNSNDNSTRCRVGT